MQIVQLIDCATCHWYIFEIWDNRCLVSMIQTYHSRQPLVGVNDTDLWQYTAFGWCCWYRLVTVYTHCLVSMIQTCDSIRPLSGVSDTDWWQHTPLVSRIQTCDNRKQLFGIVKCTFLESFLNDQTPSSVMVSYITVEVMWVRKDDRGISCPGLCWA